MKDLKTMLKKLNMSVLSEAIDDETKENVFILIHEPTEYIASYRYTDIVDAYNKKIKEGFEF